MQVFVLGARFMCVRYDCGVYDANFTIGDYSPIHIIFERPEAITVLNIWRVIQCDPTSLGPVAP